MRDTRPRFAPCDQPACNQVRRRRSPAKPAGIEADRRRTAHATSSRCPDWARWKRCGTHLVRAVWRRHVSQFTIVKKELPRLRSRVAPKGVLRIDHKDRSPRWYNLWVCLRDWGQPSLDDSVFEPSRFRVFETSEYKLPFRVAMVRRRRFSPRRCGLRALKFIGAASECGPASRCGHHQQRRKRNSQQLC